MSFFSDMNEYYVLEIALELFEDKKNYTITEAYVQQSVCEGLKQLFGEVGAAYPIEVETLSKTSYGASFILKCPALCYIKLRSSLTLQNTYYSDICVFHVLRVGTNLLELYNSKPLLTIN